MLSGVAKQMPRGAGVLSLLYRRPFISDIDEHLWAEGTALGTGATAGSPSKMNPVSFFLLRCIPLLQIRPRQLSAVPLRVL